MNFFKELAMWIFIWGVAESKLGQETQQDFNFDNNQKDFIAIFIPTETHTLDNVLQVNELF